MNALRPIGGTLLSVGVYGLLLFVPAWTVHWTRAWLLLALMFAGMLVTRLCVFGSDSSLLADRRRSPIARGQPPADKLLVVAFLIVMPAYIAFIPLDVFRLHLLRPPATAVSVLGLVMCVAGWSIVSLAFRENAFAIATVKPQAERGQTVVATGVYAAVRHPLYAGVILVLVGIALWLQSTAAAVASIVPIGLIVVRMFVEEAFLDRQLAGYAAYAKRVKFRLIPRVW